VPWPFFGEELRDQRGGTSFAPRCIEDLIEEGMFLERCDLFTGCDLVFFDTTLIYSEGQGGKNPGSKGAQQGSSSGPEFAGVRVNDR